MEGAPYLRKSGSFREALRCLAALVASDPSYRRCGGLDGTLPFYPLFLTPPYPIRINSDPALSPLWSFGPLLGGPGVLITGSITVVTSHLQGPEIE